MTKTPQEEWHCYIEAEDTIQAVFTFFMNYLTPIFYNVLQPPIHQSQTKIIKCLGLVTGIFRIFVN